MNRTSAEIPPGQAGPVSTIDVGMPVDPHDTRPTLPPAAESRTLANQIRTYFEAKELTRRGACLLNAGLYERAAEVLFRAQSINPDNTTLASLLAASYLGQEKYDAAKAAFGSVVKRHPEDVTARVRQALSAWSAGEHQASIDILRQGLTHYPNNAELQFQLGTLLASTQQYEEAELRFAQARAIDRSHVEATVGLAMCYGARGCPRDAVRCLQRAHRQRGSDARITLLLAQAAQAAQLSGEAVQLKLVLPTYPDSIDDEGMTELAQVIAEDASFLDALLSVPIKENDEDRPVGLLLYATLLRTIQLALETQPEHAELHYHCSRVLDRLDRKEEAAVANERAVGLNPMYTRALIDLAKRYQKVDRNEEAIERLEQVIQMGCHYADVYYVLGNAQRARGQVERAGEAYRRALSINGTYENAKTALASLEV